LKQMCGVPKHTKNRLIYLIADAPTLVETAVERLRLPWTPALGKFLAEWQDKFAQIDPEFLKTPAMNSKTWREGRHTMRHIVCRYAVHGFHFKFCREQSFHDPCEECVCRHCGNACELYHFEYCQNQHFASLKELAAEDE
jgi:hypothetical protein